MMLKDQKTAIIEANRTHEGDTGSPEVQVAILTERIAQLTEHLKVHAQGDLDVDAHHTVEDTAIVLGRAFLEALGDKKGIRRFGSQLLPMDETLVEGVVDISGRPYFVMNGEPENMEWQIIGGHYATVINRHFFETFAMHSDVTLHVNVRYGRDPHHITEAEYKAVARALRQAVEPDPRVSGIPSTKGAL